MKLLRSHDLTPMDNCLTFIKDNKGQIYRVPNWCINDPYYEKALNLERNSSVKMLKIVIQDIYDKSLKVDLEVMDDVQSQELKRLFFINTMPNDELLSSYKLRLIYKGCELKDTETLYEHSIPSGSVILLVKNKIDLQNLD